MSSAKFADLLHLRNQATPDQMRNALTQAMLSLCAIGDPAPNDPPDATVCKAIATDALVRITLALTS